MAEKTKFKFRLSLCRYTFTEVEVEAEDYRAAECLGNGSKTEGEFSGYYDPTAAERVIFKCGPCVHKVEQRVSVRGAPGEFRWEEVKRP